MMKRLIACILCTFCVPICYGALGDADDGYLTSGEYDFAVWLENDDELIVRGGGADRITTRDQSYLEVQYTSIPLSNNSGIYDIIVQNNSNLLYLDGITEEMTISGLATATLKGGRIDGITSYQTVGWLYGQPMGQHIEMVVKTHAYNPGSRRLTGTWADDSTFNILLVNQSGYDKVIDNIKFTIVPEPATLALLGLGGLLIRKRKMKI